MIDIIAKNPFRLLGVYSNAKQTDIVRNFSKMKAYLTVGKDVKFPTDLDFLLGPLGRTMESAQKAQSDINLPKDKIRYALFWFCKGNPMDEVALNNLANQDVSKAVDILGKRATFSSLINMAVIALIQGRYADAVSYYSQSVHNELNRTQFVSEVCGDTFQISEDELMHFVIDEMLKVVKPIALFSALSEQSDKSYASEMALSEPLSKINSEIAKAKSVSGTDAVASLRVGRALIRNTKSALSTIKTLAGASSIQYQSAADNLAKQILQCGINYYNNTGDDNDVETALELQQYALSIAVGKLVKDRCRQNVDILLQKKEQAAYEKDLAAIAVQLKTFQSAAPSISTVKSFVQKCKPHLEILKQNMGSTNELYLKVSSAVANNALGMLINVVNAAQSGSSITYGITSGSLTNTIDAAISAMSLIGSLDMTSQERTHFNQNNSTLRNIKTQLSSITRTISSSRPSSSTPSSSSSSSSSSDDTNWGCIITIIIVVVIGIISAIAG